MNLSPYPNLRRAEKIINYRKIFIQFICLIIYDTYSRKCVYSNFIIFLIASEWCSTIIVTNAFWHFILKN